MYSSMLVQAIIVIFGTVIGIGTSSRTYPYFYVPCELLECEEGKHCIDGQCVDICPAPKVFNPSSTNCFRTCKTVNDKRPRICGGVRSDVQCVCPPGLIERSREDRTCVKPSTCPCYKVRCGRNEECVDGNCQCIKGYRKSKYGVCKRICPRPKIFDPCSTACPKTCENPNPKVCTEQCRIDDCVCPDGMLEKSSKDSTCVKPEECKIPCPKPCPELSECKDGKCVCKKGLTMGNNKCYDNCIATRCGFSRPFCRRGKCWPICGEGLVRRADGSCARTCSKGKVFQKCPSFCPKRCDDPNPQHCGKTCRPIQCVCPKGYYERSLHDDTCVRLWECKRKPIY